MPPAARFAALAGRYDVVLADLWGTIHDGVRPYDGAVDALARLHAAGVKVVLMSNVPRRGAAVAALMAGMGVAPHHAIATAGDVAWQALATRTDPWHAALGTRVFHLGNVRHRELVEDNGLERVAAPEAAEFVVCTSPDPETSEIADTLPMLRRLRARGLKMVCANPDLTVMRGDTLLVCSGLMAREYERMGGEVRYHGKPHPGIYAAALAAAGDPPLARVLAVGDTPATDIAGAAALGIDTALIPGGIHGAALGCTMGALPDPALYARFMAGERAAPTWLLPAFRW